MKKKMKRLLVLIFTMLTILSAVACGKKGSSADTSGGNTEVLSEQKNNAGNNATVNLDIMETVENCLRINIVEGDMVYLDSENRIYFFNASTGKIFINLNNRQSLEEIEEVKQVVYDDYQHRAYFLLEDGKS